MQKAVQFLNDVKLEFTKVSWPNREELMQSTMVVIIVSFLVALFIGLVDLGLTHLVRIVLG